MRLTRRISFLSRPVSGTLLSRPVHFGLARCHLSSSVILHKEQPKGFGNFGSKTSDKGSRKEKATEPTWINKYLQVFQSTKKSIQPGIYPMIIPFSENF